MATIASEKVGSKFTGKYNGAERGFRVFIKNVTLTTDGSGTATVTIGSIGLRKVSGGDVDVLINYGNPRVWAQLGSGTTLRKSATSHIELDGTPPVDKNIATNWTWTVQQTSSEQTLTLSFNYKKDDGYAWSGESNGSLAVTIPAYSGGGGANEVYLTNLLSRRSGSGYVQTTFSVSGSYTVNSATVAITVNGYTYYDTPTQSGTSFTSTKYVNLQTNDTASVSVSVSVTPTGETAKWLTDGTTVSSGSESVAIDFYSPFNQTLDRYNIGIGCMAYGEEFQNANRIDIGGKLFLNGTEITGGGGGEPASYIKSISTSGNTLSYTNQDDTTNSYTPSATVNATFSVTTESFTIGNHSAGDVFEFTDRTCTNSGFLPLGIVGEQSAYGRLIMHPYLADRVTGRCTLKVKAAAEGTLTSGSSVTFYILWVK